MLTNPLLDKQHSIPSFDLIQAQHIEPAIQALIPKLNQQLESLEKTLEPSWEGLVEPLVEIEESLQGCWTPVEHLNSVANSPELRDAYNVSQKAVIDFGLRVNQSQPIFDALERIHKTKVWSSLNGAQQRAIEQRLLGAKLAGLSLQGAERDEFNALSRDLSELESAFANHVLDATKEFILVIDKKESAEGWPASLLELTSHVYNQRFPDKAKSSPASGPWAVSLDAPVMVAFLENCQDRNLRKQIYLAYISRASAGKHDNTPLITQILIKRKRLAKLLGYENYAALSLARKMVRSVEQVFQFEEELRTVSLRKAKEEFAELTAFAKKAGEANALQQWDMGYWAKRLQEHKFSFTDEELRPYFSLDQVLLGLFSLVKRLFSISVEAADKQAPVWHKDVRFFNIFDESKKHIASFYLDPFSRPANKKGGAWMADCVVRSVNGDQVTLPVAHLVCNFTPPTENRPSLLNFQEVLTLFHEFGHGLQHMLTRVDYPDVSGIRGVEWDAVELPSQFMENWCYHRKTLKELGRHYLSGESIPDALVDKIIASHNYRAASQMLRQIQFALIDMKLHSYYDPEGAQSIFSLHEEVVKLTSILPYFAEDRTLCAFSHIFAGGYAAGYYSYKWAEVMSADAYGAFEEKGLDDEKAVRATGKKFRDTILALGGSRDPLQVFIDFRGRAPSTEALLRHSGLAS